MQLPSSPYKKNFQAGEVALVGAGPGDVELLTIQALKFIQQAEVVVYDRLVSDEIMDLVPENCERIYVGKKQANHRVPQQGINELLVTHAQRNKKVVRLKGGDPFVFGRGGEEALHLLANNVNCHVVPGVTAASACTAYSGIPLTHREVAQSCTFITGHTQASGELDLPWHILSDAKQTVVFYMGIKSLPIIVKQLTTAGRPESTPAALIHKGTQANQKVIRATLETLEQVVSEQGIKPPTLIVIGDTVATFPEEMNNEFGYFSAES